MHTTQNEKFFEMFSKNRKKTQQTLDIFLEQKTNELKEISNNCTPLINSIKTLTNNGKKLRAIICFWGWQSVTETKDETNIYKIAAALELFQAAALIHDDIIDNSDTRRNNPTTHKTFSQLHENQNLVGDPENFGKNSAILCGDLCLAWSEELFGQIPQISQKTKEIFNLMRTEVMAGQYLEILQEKTPFSITEKANRQELEEAKKILTYKSAKYSIKNPLLLGATFGLSQKTPQTLLENYAKFGMAIGKAFQLRDDVLDIFGDPDIIGKPINGDLQSSKKTVLITLTKQKSNTKEKIILESLLKKTEKQSFEIDILKKIILECGALQEVEDTINKLYEDAFAILEKIEIDKKSKSALQEIINFATKRNV